MPKKAKFGCGNGTCDIHEHPEVRRLRALRALFVSNRTYAKMHMVLADAGSDRYRYRRSLVERLIGTLFVKLEMPFSLVLRNAIGQTLFDRAIESSAGLMANVVVDEGANESRDDADGRHVHIGAVTRLVLACREPCPRVVGWLNDRLSDAIRRAGESCEDPDFPIAARRTANKMSRHDGVRFYACIVTDETLRCPLVLDVPEPENAFGLKHLYFGGRTFVGTFNDVVPDRRTTLRVPEDFVVLHDGSDRSIAAIRNGTFFEGRSVPKEGNVGRHDLDAEGARQRLIKW